MSSHHIVREKQEPALLVLSLTGFDAEHLGQLLEWSPTVIATPDTIWQLLAEDIHVDWLLTESNENPTTQTDLHLISSKPGQWMADGMGELISKSYPAVNVITDDLLIENYLPYLEQLTIVIYCQQQKAYAIKSGFEKWKPAGTIIKLMQLPVKLAVENLSRLDENTYEVTSDGFIKLIFNDTTIMISEQI